MAKKNKDDEIEKQEKETPVEKPGHEPKPIYDSFGSIMGWE